MATKKQIELCKEIGHPYTVIPKAERYDIYKKALIHYMKYNTSNYCIIGLCSAIEEATHDDINKTIYLSYINRSFHYSAQNLHDICTIRYPELNKFKPKKYESYWWDKQNYSKRVNILKQCIELSKPKKLK